MTDLDAVRGCILALIVLALGLWRLPDRSCDKCPHCATQKVLESIPRCPMCAKRHDPKERCP